MAKSTKKNAAKLDRENLTTFTSITYQNVKMINGERVGKCPRGKKIACNICMHIVASDDIGTLNKCLNFDVDEARLYPLREEKNRTVHALVYKDAVIHQGIVVDVIIIGKVKDIKDPVIKGRIVDGISYSIRTVLEGTYPITLISE